MESLRRTGSPGCVVLWEVHGDGGVVEVECAPVERGDVEKAGERADGVAGGLGEMLILQPYGTVLKKCWLPASRSCY